MVRKILFKAVAIGIKTVTRGERDGTQLQTQQEQVGCIVKEQVGGWAFLGGNFKAKGFLLNPLHRILAEGNNLGDQTSSVGRFSPN